MKNGGIFSRFMETMGIMVETVEDNGYAREPIEDEEIAYTAPQAEQPVYQEEAPAAAYQPPVMNQQPTAARAKKGNVIDMQHMQNTMNGMQQPASSMYTAPTPSMSVLVYRPASFEDTQKIIDNVKGHRPVIVNLDALETDEAQRSLDFLSGASYALDGKVFKVASNIFVLAPVNVDITGNIQNEMYAAADEFFELED